MLATVAIAIGLAGGVALLLQNWIGGEWEQSLRERTWDDLQLLTPAVRAALLMISSP